MSDRTPIVGLLDTNVFIHAHAHDRHTDECRRFLHALETGAVLARLDPLVLHELSYALPHHTKHLTREQIAEYLLMVLSWDGVQGEKDVMVGAVENWRASPRLAFVDAYLAVLSAKERRPVFSKNVAVLAAQGVTVPNPLPV